MSGREFICLWLVAISSTAAIVGWAFLVQVFGLPIGATVMLGVAVPVAAVMAALWAAVRTDRDGVQAAPHPGS